MKSFATMSARACGSRSQRTGRIGEEHARVALRMFGVQQLVHIETGWRVQRQPGGRIVGAIPLAKVPGDWRGVLQGGRSVMAEVKAREEPPIWSDLAKHQHEALAEHARLGGLSLLVWVQIDQAAFILPYPCPGFAFRAPRLSECQVRTAALAAYDLIRHTFTRAAPNTNQGSEP